MSALITKASLIGKAGVGAGARGVLNYNLAKSKGAEIIGGNMAGRTARELAKEFSISRRLRPNLRKAVGHHSLSASSGKRLTNEEWQKAVEIYLKEMGYDVSKNQFVIIRHSDRPHDHVHIVVSRVGLDGSVVSDSNDRKKCHKATAKAALAVGLKPVPPSDKTKPRVRISRDEVEHAERLGTIHPKLTVAARLDVAIAHSRDFEQFKINALKLGIEVREVSNTGGVYGISYGLSNPPKGFRVTAWKGSTIGPGYSFKHVQKRLAGEGMDQIVNAEARRFKTTLDFTKAEFGKNGKTVQRWQNGSVAAIYTDTAISFRFESAASVRLTAQLAAKMGWKEVHLGGTEERRRLAEIEYAKLGIKVSNPLNQPETSHAQPFEKTTATGPTTSASTDAATPSAQQAEGGGNSDQNESERKGSHMATINPLQIHKITTKAQEHERLTEAFLVDREFWNKLFTNGGTGQIEQRAQDEAKHKATFLLADTSATGATKRDQLLKQLEEVQREQKIRVEKATKAQEKRDQEHASPLKPDPK